MFAPPRRGEHSPAIGGLLKNHHYLTLTESKVAKRIRNVVMGGVKTGKVGKFCKIEDIAKVRRNCVSRS